ncbi:MAG: alpha/beta fold hydrolase, partial [Thermoguttaceae bacterium]
MPKRLCFTSIVVFFVFFGSLFAQTGNNLSKKSAAGNSAAQAELPEPEDIVLKTADSLRLALSYYPGTKGKESIPVVLLHAWKGNRTDYTRDLASFLQAKGYAVIVPDLRGHGESTRLTSARAKDETLSAVS